jgi:hypothetical protein
MKKARLIAFYLPQFHPIPENNAWWGQGFTEWRNVTRAKPLFPGHRQPNLPADLGFYDLRVAETREAQAALARQAGVEAFCYWHYWFGGRRILERPFQEVLASGKPDFPFCLGWANESWQGIWHGCDRRLLIEQTYPGPEDYEAHFMALLPAFRDRRHLRIHGKPAFLIFRPRNLPDAGAFIRQWRQLADHHGLPGIHFIAHLFGTEEDYPFREEGFDAAVMTNALKVMEHRLPAVITQHVRTCREAPTSTERLRRGLEAGKRIGRLVLRRLVQRPLRWPGSVYSYQDAMMFFGPQRAIELGMYPSMVPNWDNSPRAGRKAVILTGARPELFGRHAREVIDSVSHRPREERIVFVKSWNEWAEGNYLEPDQTHGHGFLRELNQAVESADTPAD